MAPDRSISRSFPFRAAILREGGGEGGFWRDPILNFQVAKRGPGNGGQNSADAGCGVQLSYVVLGPASTYILTMWMGSGWAFLDRSSPFHDLECFLLVVLLLLEIESRKRKISSSLAVGRGEFCILTIGNGRTMHATFFFDHAPKRHGLENTIQRQGGQSPPVFTWPVAQSRMMEKAGTCAAICRGFGPRLENSFLRAIGDAKGPASPICPELRSWTPDSVVLQFQSDRDHTGTY